jgi:hypothetical protein
MDFIMAIGTLLGLERKVNDDGAFVLSGFFDLRMWMCMWSSRRPFFLVICTVKTNHGTIRRVVLFFSFLRKSTVPLWGYLTVALSLYGNFSMDQKKK